MSGAALFDDVAELELLEDRPLPALRVPLAFTNGRAGQCVVCGHGRPLHGPWTAPPVACTWDGCDCATRAIITAGEGEAQ